MLRDFRKGLCIVLMEEMRRQIVRYGVRLLEAGLTRGTGGNLSAMDRSLGLVALSPSGIPYREMRPEDVPVLDLSGKVVEGLQRPSSEKDLHLQVYRRRSDACAVVHAHSTFATTLACLGWELPAVHYLVGFAGRKVPLAPYETFGTPELAAAVADVLGESFNAVLMANHGMLALGRDLPTAFNTAEETEFVAELYYRSSAVGEPVLLTEEQMDAAMARFRDYGPRKRERA